MSIIRDALSTTLYLIIFPPELCVSLSRCQPETYLKARNEEKSEMHLPCLRDNLRSIIKGGESEIVFFLKNHHGTYWFRKPSSEACKNCHGWGLGQAVYPENASLSADSSIAYLHPLAHKLPRTGTLPALSIGLIPAPCLVFQGLHSSLTDTFSQRAFTVSSLWAWLPLCLSFPFFRWGKILRLLFTLFSHHSKTILENLPAAIYSGKFWDGVHLWSQQSVGRGRRIWVWGQVDTSRAQKN